jgi:hypothetical protein
MVMRGCLVMLVVLAAARPAAADEIPIITLTDVGVNQEIPTSRAFYVAGDAGSTVETAQAIVVRKGSPSLLGDAGPDCHDLIADLHVDVVGSAGDDDDDDGDSSPPPVELARYDAGRHHAFEVFPRASPMVRNAAVLVSAAWQRPSAAARDYKVLVPHDGGFFAAGFSYCLFVVATERAQQLDDVTLAELVDGVAKKLVACGDKSSCDDDALSDYEARVERQLAASRTIAAGPASSGKLLAAKLKHAARTELGAATGIVEARDHLHDRWRAQTNVMTPLAAVVWADTSTDPFAHATATMLARAAALLPQVRPGAKPAVALYTTDGRLEVRAVQVLDDGRSIRVASSKAPRGDQARVLTATTDTLAVADGITLYDLIQLGQGRVHIDERSESQQGGPRGADKDWISLAALGDRVSALGLDTWTADDAAYLHAATAHMKRLADFVDLVTTGVACKPGPLDSNEAEHTADAVRRHLGEWLVCQHIDAGALEVLTDQLEELGKEDDSWRAARDKLAEHSKRIVTVTATSPLATRVGFASRTWAFSYVTPIAGYAGVLRADDAFGLMYLGAQIHFEPNPVADGQWRHGVTAHDLRRAVALEIAVAPNRSSFGPEHRYDGPGALPPVLVGLALHVIPYTSFTFGGIVLDRKLSTLPQEQAHTIVAPYIGFTLQLNLPDLIRHSLDPTSDTTVSR